MKVIKLQKVVEEDGYLNLDGLPCKKGDSVELVLSIESAPPAERPVMTMQDLLDSGLVGLWKDRTDIGDSAEFARRLREEAQHRRR